MIVSSGSMIESVSVCTSNVALDALFSVTTGVIGLKSVPDVAVPLICNATCTSPPALPPLTARVTLPPSATVPPPVIVISGRSFGDVITVVAAGESPRS